MQSDLALLIPHRADEHDGPKRTPILMMIANFGIVVQVPGVEGFLDLHSRCGIGARSHHEVVALAENLLAIIPRHSEERVVGIDDGITGKGRIRENDRHPSLVNGVDEWPSGLECAPGAGQMELGN